MLRYIHANYRFVVDPRGDYRKQVANADENLDWSSQVLQILASAQSQLDSCPICLSTPVAPRMAKCGHIFCLPCLIRYMHSTDDAGPVPEKKTRWKKCPICFDSMSLTDMRPVRWFRGQEAEAPREGQDVVLRLVMRHPMRTIALPRDGAESLLRSEDVPWLNGAEVMDYARIMKGGEDYMIESYDCEIEELLSQEKEDELMFGDESQWYKKAIRSVTEAKEKVRGIPNPPIVSQKLEERKVLRPPIRFAESSDGAGAPAFDNIQHAAKSGESRPLNSTDISSRETQPSNSDSHSHLEPDHVRHRGKHFAKTHHPTEEPGVYFYQALLNYYLAPLDVRILLSAFGEYSTFPSTILPRVERVVAGHIVDDDLRKRAKNLSHLPYGCEVNFLECDWSYMVKPEVLEQFKSEIESRRKEHVEKDAREEKERLRAEREEDDKRWAAARRRRPSIPSKGKSVAEISFENEHTEFHIGSASSADLNVASSSPPWLSSQNRSGSAFASLASPSTSPMTAKTVWGTRIVLPSSPQHEAVHIVEDVPEHDGWLQDWERDLLQDEMLASQVQSASINEGSSKAAPATPQGKKKKQKKITLMSTNGRRQA